MSERISLQKCGELLVTIHTSAWRLELLDQYELDDSARRYLHGERDFPDPQVDEWLVTLRGILGAGKSYGRVHLIPHELTPYLEYEIFDGYKRTAAVGERIGLIEGDPAEVFQGLEWPGRDFWIFDDDTVVLLNYDSAGRPIDGVVSNDPVLLRQCQAVRDRAEKLATPLAEYLAKHQDQVVG